MRARLFGFYSKSKFKSGGHFHIRHGEKSGTIRVGQLYQTDGCAVLCFVPTLASIGDMRYFTVRWVPVCLMDPLDSKIRYAGDEFGRRGEENPWLTVVISMVTDTRFLNT